MDIDLAALPPRERYKLLISLAVPRPIAWTSTVGLDGSTNLAPFSFFNLFQINPFPVLAIGIGTRRNGQPKDTLRNITDTGEFVVNLVTEDDAEAMNASSGTHAYGVDEFEVAGLTKEPSAAVKPPRVAESPVALECRTFQLMPLTRSREAEATPHSTLVLGEIVHARVRDDLVADGPLVDTDVLRPVARLGGTAYWRRGEVFHMERPEVADDGS